jgi:hypothetical protein
LGKKKPVDTTPTAPASTDAGATAPVAPAEAPKSTEDKAKDKLKKLLKF